MFQNNLDYANKNSHVSNLFKANFTVEYIHEFCNLTKPETIVAEKLNCSYFVKQEVISIFQRNDHQIQ